MGPVVHRDEFLEGGREGGERGRGKGGRERAREREGGRESFYCEKFQFSSHELLKDVMVDI